MGVWMHDVSALGTNTEPLDADPGRLVASLIPRKDWVDQLPEKSKSEANWAVNLCAWMSAYAPLVGQTNMTKTETCDPT